MINELNLFNSKYYVKIMVIIFILSFLLSSYFFIPKIKGEHCKGKENGEILECIFEADEKTLTKDAKLLMIDNVCVKTLVDIKNNDDKTKRYQAIPCSIDWDNFKSDGWKLYLLLFNTILTIIFTSLITSFSTKKIAYKSFEPSVLKKGVLMNNVLLVGLGRSGKSKLISALKGGNQGDEIKLTEKFSVTKFSDITDKITRNYLITDYRGQSLQQLVSNFIMAQLKPYSELRYGTINTLILIVDLFPYIEKDNIEQQQIEDARQFNAINNKRVEYHIKQWSLTALDAVFGLLTKKNLKLVCLFINKSDKLRIADANKKEENIRSAFKPLIDDLELRTAPNGRNAENTIDFNVVIGSVITGKNITGNDNSIRSLLASHCISNDG